MINKSFSLMVGMTLLVSCFPGQSLAYPARVRISPNAGVHRTIVVPNTRVGGGYSRNRSNFSRGRTGNYYSRERIIIQRDNRGYCSNCNYRGRSYPSRYDGGYNQYYNPSGRYNYTNYYYQRNRY
ncbi:MAG: hypothetical protein AAGF26_05865 [Cyanobacteria bacterium P01_G01_bin.49]